MNSAYDKYCDIVIAYGDRISKIGIDKLEIQLQKMKDRSERWGNDFSFALASEIKKRGHQIDYNNYKIIYHAQETND